MNRSPQDKHEQTPQEPNPERGKDADIERERRVGLAVFAVVVLVLFPMTWPDNPVLSFVLAILIGTIALIAARALVRYRARSK